jgi:hypothetical protein
MRKYSFVNLIIILTALLVFPYSTFAKGNPKDKNNKGKVAKIQKVTADPSNTILDINNITSWTDAAGFQQPLVGQSWNGTFPKGTDGVIYQEGIVWGGLVHDGGSEVVRVGGNTYSNGTTGLTRIFRVRPDYKTADLTDDAANFFQEPATDVTSAQIQQLRDQYAKDWKEWPADKGAPWYVDTGKVTGQSVRFDNAYDPNNSLDIPGIPGANQTLWTSYDDRNSTDIYGSEPIGLQVNETWWGYTTPKLANVTFKKVDIIYKGTATTSSNATIDSLYITQWADPDVGNSTDDYAGCDTALNLGYSYNATITDIDYAQLGLPVPAVGYDFLQGVSKYTGNPNDSAIVNLKWRKGYKYVNKKPMSGFEYFAAGGTWEDPDLGDYNGSLQWYNLQRGYLPRPYYPSSTPFPSSVADTVNGSTYLVDGDPVAGTGKLDGSVDASGDRRIMVNNGPFTMNLGDTAQVVVALVGGMGTNNISSVAVLKYNDTFAQFAFDNLFDIPTIQAPKVQTIALNQKVTLDWSKDTTLDKSIEMENHSGYAFQGYIVYQLPTASSALSDGVIVKTFDKVDLVKVVFDDEFDSKTGYVINEPVVFGNDNGVQRFISMDKDYILNTTLKNGQTYYYAVLSYAYSNAPGVAFHILQSNPTRISVVPHTLDPGVRYGASTGDTLKVTHTGNSTGTVTPIVVDPTATNGHSYEVTFTNDTSTVSDAPAMKWHLKDLTQNKVLFNSANLSGVGTGALNQPGTYNPIIAGVYYSVLSPSLGISDYGAVPNANRWFTGTNWGGTYFFGGMDLGANFFGSDATVYVPVDLKFVGGPNSPSVAGGWSQGAVYRRDKSYGYEGVGWLPMTAWDISDPANPKQINMSFVEDANDGSANNQWDLGWNGSTFAANGGREYLFINNTPYDPNHYNGTIDGTFNDVDYAIWPDGRAGHTYLEGPFDFYIYPSVPISLSDKYTFTSTKADTSNSVAKTDVNKINVFPNPYYGYQNSEPSRQSHYVTFSHLPQNATIRIFDLSGVLVRTIHKTGASQFYRWDLQNNNNYPVASGIYVAYIDMPDIGATKILKLAIVQEEQILNVY